MAALPDDRRRWEPFGITEADFAAVPERDGMRVVSVRFGGGPGAMAGRWLAGAAGVLALLAAAAAAVSWQAQDMMVRAVKHAAVVAAIEAGIPDAGALVFAALGVALALHGKRAVRARALNAACIGISLAMNALAAGHGWRGLAIWVMPASVYALASDTLISVVRAWVLARQRGTGGTLADDGPTPLAVAGGVVLWLLWLALAPRSTLAGFRAWVVEDCPVAPALADAARERAELRAWADRQVGALPAELERVREDAGHLVQLAREEASGRIAAATELLAADRDRLAAELRGMTLSSSQARRAAPRAGRPRGSRGGGPTKRDRMIELAGQRRDLASVPPGEVARLAGEVAAEIGYSPGTARRELARHVRQLQAASAAARPGDEGGNPHG